MIYVTHRGLLYWALYEAGYFPVSIHDGVATMRCPT